MPSIPLNCVAYPHQMTEIQLLYLGIDQVTYLKVGVFAGEQGCMIYSAAGVPFEFVDNVEAAMEAVAENNLSLVIVH
jgi:hypothetical protein